ncbi:MAG: hypothetical protein JSV88_20335, partial [Candidatus Aminicenantes bacterium]
MIDRSLFKLFSYPLPDPTNTNYHKLRISPEATSSEIREAKAGIVSQLKSKQSEVQKKLNSIYKEIEGLKQTYEDVKNLRNKGKDADNYELIKMEKHLAKLEKKTLETNPNYKQLLNQFNELEQKIFEINRINLENPKERSAYDKTNPPCALLKLENCDPAIFTPNGKKLALFLLRVELCNFLTENGEECYHPGD